MTLELFVCKCTDGSWGIGTVDSDGKETIFSDVFETERAALAVYLQIVDLLEARGHLRGTKYIRN